jgi:hypothetical protein
MQQVAQIQDCHKKATSFFFMNAQSSLPLASQPKIKAIDWQNAFAFRHLATLPKLAGPDVKL